jgi:hypothetical protein
VAVAVVVDTIGHLRKLELTGIREVLDGILNRCSCRLRHRLTGLCTIYKGVLMGVLIALMFLGLVLWLSWAYLRNPVRLEAVSRDLENVMTEEAIARVKEDVKLWSKLEDE